MSCEDQSEIELAGYLADLYDEVGAELLSRFWKGEAVYDVLADLSRRAELTRAITLRSLNDTVSSLYGVLVEDDLQAVEDVMKAHPPWVSAKS